MLADHQVTYSKLLRFFIPLGISASLVSLSHVIINGTLTRAEDAERIIAAYSIALSLLGIMERPAVLLRQTCSALVRDRVSYTAMWRVSGLLFGSILALGFLISYTPFGGLLFRTIFRVEDALLADIIDVYRIVMFVSLFSGLRCLYHGVIIYSRRTKWLTIGMIIRLSGMALLALGFVAADAVRSATVGAVIFLAGMVIEAAVATWEGRRVAAQLPLELKEHEVKTGTHIFRFYQPLLLSSLIAVIVSPAINAFLGYTSNMELAIASFAIASSMMMLITTFFSYIHQIVLNFYDQDRSKVIRFTAMLSLLPSLLIISIAYTPLGYLVLTKLMLAGDRLAVESLNALQMFVIFTLIYPWLEFGNGMLLLRAQTKVTVVSQSANVAATVVTLIIATTLAAGWNGAVGSLALSMGFTAEFAVVWIALALSARSQSQLPANRIRRNL